METTPPPRGWWCALCAAAVEPSWLGRAEAIAYHRFGEPPFVARHSLTPVAAPPVAVPALAAPVGTPLIAGPYGLAKAAPVG